MKEQKPAIGHEQKSKLTMIDIMFSTVLGFGFSQFPKNPIYELSSTMLFLLTMSIGITDWFGNHYYSKTVKTKFALSFFIVQILTLLILSQLFYFSGEEDMKMWFFYLGLYLNLYIIWNLLTTFNNRTFYITIIATGTLLFYFLSYFYDHFPLHFLGFEIKLILTLFTALISLTSIFIYNFFTKNKLFDTDRIIYSSFNLHMKK
jgi:hypothetical protein